MKKRPIPAANARGCVNAFSHGGIDGHPVRHLAMGNSVHLSIDVRIIHLMQWTVAFSRRRNETRNNRWKFTPTSRRQLLHADTGLNGRTTFIEDEYLFTQV
jgi:hypothetical protein